MKGVPIIAATTTPEAPRNIRRDRMSLGWLLGIAHLVPRPVGMSQRLVNELRTSSKVRLYLSG